MRIRTSRKNHHLRALRETGWEEGVVTAEYALLLALIAIAIVSTAVIFGLNVSSLFDKSSAGVGGA
jgi:Flp pilus assembly pilin Flp